MKRAQLGLFVAVVGLASACGATANSPRVGSNRWVHAEAGLTIPIPAGWELRALNGRELLVRDAIDGFADNINVLILPHDGSPIEAQLDKTKQAIGRLPGVSLAKLAVERHAGQRGLVLEFHGRLPKQQHDVHVRSFTYIRNNKLIVVTATVLRSRWEEMQAKIAELLGGVTIRPS